MKERERAVGGGGARGEGSRGRAGSRGARMGEFLPGRTPPGPAAARLRRPTAGPAPSPQPPLPTTPFPGPERARSPLDRPASGLCRL